MTTTTRPAHLHFTPGRIAALLLVELLLDVIVLAALLVSHYGTAATLNEGYVLGSDTSTVEVGLEVRGDPGVFGHLTTPLGVASLYDGEVGWCPAGASDLECGA